MGWPAVIPARRGGARRRRARRGARSVLEAVGGAAPARSGGTQPARRLSESELREARERIEPLVQAAQESLDRLYLAVGRGRVLRAARRRQGRAGGSARGGRPTMRPQRLEALDRRLWSESAEGTNGIGTCLVEQRALIIHRDQHFFSRNTALSCTTAPSSTRGAAGGRPRRLFLPRRSDRGVRRADRGRGAGRGAAHRGGGLPPRVPRRARPGGAGHREDRRRADRRRPPRPGDRGDARRRQALGLTPRAWRGPAGRGSHRRPGGRSRRRRARGPAAGAGAGAGQRLGGGAGARHQPRDALPQAQAPRSAPPGLRPAGRRGQMRSRRNR